jgi:hypothetical protein
MPIISKTGGAALRSWGFNFQKASVAAGEQVAAGYWPPAYESLINSTVYTKYFINQSTGSDTNDGLSEATPFASFDKFVTVTANLTNAIMAVVYPGTYNVTMTAVGVDAMYTDNGKARVIVGYPGTTILSYVANRASRDCPMMLLSNPLTRLYGLILKRNNNARTANYSVAFFYGFSYFQAKVYNCVYQEVGTNRNWSLGYANSGWTVTPSVNYCTFAVYNAGLGDYTGAATLTIDHCLFNKNYTSTPSTLTFNQFLSISQTMDFTTYKTTGGITYTSGVYNGTYAWPA